MKPWNHLLMGVGVFYLLILFRFSLDFAISFFISSILIDIDHIFDYIFLVNRKAINPFIFIKSLKHFLLEDWYKDVKIIIFFHSYEVILILFFLSFFYSNNMLLGVSYGLLFHLICDFIANVYINPNVKTNPLIYSFIYRNLLDFDYHRF